MKDYEMKVERGDVVTIKVKNDDGIRIKIGHTYTRGNDATIIWEWIWKGEKCLRERIIGYYHGEPNKEDTKDWAFRGVEGVIDLDFDEIFED